MPGRSAISSVSPPRPAKSPRSRRCFSRPAQAASTPRASPLSSASSNTPRTRQSTPSVAKPFVQTPNSIHISLPLRRACVTIYLGRASRAPRSVWCFMSARGAATAASGGKCNSRARRVSGRQASSALGNTLGRYVLREVVTAWLVVTGVLLVILLANQVVGVLERAAANQYPQGVVLELIGLGALQNLSLLIPVGLLLGVVLAFGRMYHDSEMAAALACGVGPGSIYRPVALLALLVAAVLAWLTLSLAPDATEQTLSLRGAAARAGRFAAIAPGKFRTFGGTSVVYAEDVNPDGTLGNVFVE